MCVTSVAKAGSDCDGQKSMGRYPVLRLTLQTARKRPRWSYAPLRGESGVGQDAVNRAGKILADWWGRGTMLLSTGLDTVAERVVLFRIGDFVFVTFGLFAAVGTSVSLAGAAVLMTGQGELSPGRFLTLALMGSAAVVCGAWLAAQILDYRLVLRSPRTALRRPVFVSWGGLLGMLITVLVCSWGFDVELLVLLDALARTMPLGHALGRVGCLSYGCCFGRPTAARLAVTYRDPAAKAVRVAGLEGVKLHPVPFYEAVLDLAILLLTNVAALTGAPLGAPAAIALLLYGAGRFGIEFLRNNEGRIVVGSLSLNHIISLAVAFLGSVGMPFFFLLGQDRPVVAWSAVLSGAPLLVVAIGSAAVIVFVGFSVHRGRVGAW